MAHVCRTNLSLLPRHVIRNQWRLGRCHCSSPFRVQNSSDITLLHEDGQCWTGWSKSHSAAYCWYLTSVFIGPLSLDTKRLASSYFCSSSSVVLLYVLGCILPLLLVDNAMPTSAANFTSIQGSLYLRSGACSNRCLILGLHLGEE